MGRQRLCENYPRCGDTSATEDSKELTGRWLGPECLELALDRTKKPWERSPT